MELFSSAWAQAGAVGVVFLFVMLLALGRWVPLSTVNKLLDQAQKRADAEARNADRWQAAAEANDKRADLLAEQLGEILAVMRSVQDLVRHQRETA